MTTQPVIAQVTRGTTVESEHHGAYAVWHLNDGCIASAGDVARPVFPRSAIKAFQCLPLIESGAAARFGLTDEDIALCCASHGGEAEHVRVAAGILAKIQRSEADYECGAHWPFDFAAQRELAKAGTSPRAIHNNCSGKHAGMLALATHLGVDPHGYVTADHAVQRAVAITIARMCDVDVASAPVGIDGCSVPTWAFPLTNMAMGFARLARPGFSAGEWIIRAARNHPFMIAGTGKFDTAIMQKIPRLFIKVGAEGVYCGTIAHAGIGFALKCEDGASRAAEAAIAGVLLNLECWTDDERAILVGFATTTMKNWNSLTVGEIRSTV